MRANLKNNQGDQQSRNERHTFVLVHGGWCGGWIWRYVAPALRERGHVVTTPTLTGLGERRHSENRTATLSTHIEDIVAHIEMEGFQDVTLVSQSYGGMVRKSSSHSSVGWCISGQHQSSAGQSSQAGKRFLQLVFPNCLQSGRHGDISFIS